MGQNKKNRIDTENPVSPSFRPFEGLFPSSGVAAEENPDMPGPGTDENSSSSEDTLQLKGVFSLRKEKRGRGGKTVTFLSGTYLVPEEAEKLAKLMRKALGCGSRSEEGMVVLQGDLRDRAKSWLLDHGAKKVVVG